MDAQRLRIPVDARWVRMVAALIRVRHIHMAAAEMLVRRTVVAHTGVHPAATVAADRLIPVASAARGLAVDLVAHGPAAASVVAGLTAAEATFLPVGLAAAISAEVEAGTLAAAGTVAEEGAVTSEAVVVDTPVVEATVDDAKFQILQQRYRIKPETSPA